MTETRTKAHRGYVLLSVAFMLLMFLGFLGLAIDLGYFFYVRRQMQKATDAAAIGGEHAVFLGQTSQSQVNQAGWNDASFNGFIDCRFAPSNCQANVTVTLNIPPATGPYASDDRAVEAIINEPVPTLFMRAFGMGTVPVRTRAVAHLGSAAACIYALDPTASGALTVKGTSTVTSNCGVIDDSNASNALQVNGTTSTLTGTTVSVTGGESGTGIVNCTSGSPCPATSQPPAPDPLSYLAPPSYSTCDYTNTVITTTGTVNLNPGTYCGGIIIQSQATVNFATGTYVLAGGTAATGSTCPSPQTSCTVGLSVTGGATLNGMAGVTFYNTGPIGTPSACGEIYVAGNTNSNLAAPTTGDLSGILFFQNRDCTAQATVQGTSTSQGYNGALYFADANLTFAGTSTSTKYTIVVANTLTFGGTPLFNNDYSSLPGGSPVKGVVLGE
jgi:Putative Flp pilus-assembly TadE/G-like